MHKMIQPRVKWKKGCGVEDRFIVVGFVLSVLELLLLDPAPGRNASALEVPPSPLAVSQPGWTGFGTVGGGMVALEGDPRAGVALEGV